MAVNSRDMLPKYLLENEMLSDLFKVENIAINDFYDYVLRLKDEFNITSADEMLSRYEKIFDLKGSGDKADRIRKILLKLNTRGSCRKKDIEELVSFITGCDSEVIEHFSDYSFDIVAGAFIDINNKVIADVNAGLEEIKPAHIAFKLILALESIKLKNKNDLIFDLLDIVFNHNAFGEEKHYLDGSYLLDGSKLLDCGILKKLSLSYFEVKAKIKNNNTCEIKIERN